MVSPQSGLCNIDTASVAFFPTMESNQQNPCVYLTGFACLRPVFKVSLNHFLITFDAFWSLAKMLPITEPCLSSF